MHTPTFVRGPGVDRIYYAGRMTQTFGGTRSRYAIGFLEWDGEGWQRGPGPVLSGDPERPSALEPFVRHDGDRWRMFFDNTVTDDGGTMILARGTNLYGTRPYPEQGLWISEGGSESRRLLDTDASAEDWYVAGVCGPAAVIEGDRMHVFATGTHAPLPWWRAALGRLRQGRTPPAPAPYFLTTGRFSFRR